MQEIDKDYQLLAYLLSELIPLKSPYRNKSALPQINDFENKITKLLRIKYPEENDPDIIALRNKISNMQQQISSLKQQLKL